MKVNWILAATLACATATGVTLTLKAEDYRVYSVSDAREAKSVSQEIQEGSASDMPAMSAPAGAACDSCAEEPAEEEDDCPRCYVFNQDNCRGIKVHGWLNGGYFANSHGNPSHYNGPVTFADRNDGQINQVYGVIEKPLDTSECCWDIGGRFDVLYGTDWVYNTQVGWETNGNGDLLDGWNNSPYYGLVTPQAYAEVGYGDLSVKAGRFYTVMGYEVVTAPNNFFATHAYTMQYAEPFSHTGAIATWKANDNWTLIGGGVNGWDRFAGSDTVRQYDRLAGIGGAIYTPDHGKYTITLTAISGSERTFDAADNTDRTLYSLVFSYNVTDKLTYVLQHDNGWQDDTMGVGATRQNAEWYGVNQYLFYTINDCWKAGLRAEWFRDDDGVRVAGVRPDNGADAGNVTATPGGYDGHFFEITAGLNWTPHANLIVRPEVRYDWYDDSTAGFGNNSPFNDGTSNSQFVFGLDAVVLW